MILDGHIASHDKKSFLGYVKVDKNTGLIEEVGRGRHRDSDRHYDDECLIFAGMGDIHIHAREDQTGIEVYKESYRSAGDAALNGGCVHVSAMPNTPKPLTDESDFKWHRNRVEEILHPVTILNYIGIDKNTYPIGAPGEHMYKCFFAKSIGDLSIVDEIELDKVLSKYKSHHISFHVEYEPVIQANTQEQTHSDRRPIEASIKGLELLLPLIKKYNIHTKLCHWCDGLLSFNLIEEYRSAGYDITLEVSPTHLMFDTSMTSNDPDLLLKTQVNPAIHTPEHRAGLIEALKSGVIDYLATDHAPHTLEEKYSAFEKYRKSYGCESNVSAAEVMKEKDFEKYSEVCRLDGKSGVPWLDVYANVCVYLMKKHQFTSMDIARIASYNPGRFINRFINNQFTNIEFGKGFGEIQKGFLGSFTILNLNNETSIDNSALKTKVGWSAIAGMQFEGGLENVIVRGKEL